MKYHIQVPCLSLTGVTSYNVNNPKLGKEVFCQHSSHQGSVGVSSSGLTPNSFLNAIPLIKLFAEGAARLQI